ncbi:ABC transporter substrate-binding protein [Psychromonas sp. MME2]|uniref:ABC transporter substrate-binding protein n=1 Tax=unclassified Psychromonas TaxID=2614957 RepID=UPI00339C9E44
MRPLFIILLSTLLNGCYQQANSLSDTLIYCSQALPQSFNPQLSNNQATLDATTNQLFNRLIKVDPNNDEIIAELASDWSISEDNKSYIFHLRKDVPFQQTEYFTPTRNFNADDVLFSFNRLIDIASPFHDINSDQGNYFFNHPFKNLISNLSKIDEHTIKIELKKPVSAFLTYLAAHYAVIHSQEYASSLLSSNQPSRMDYYPVGTGPYQFKNSNGSGVIRFDSNPLYWGKTPAIKHVIFDTTKNNSKRFAKLLSGECDIMTNPAPSQLRHISLNKSITVSNRPTNNLSLLAFNSTKKTLSNSHIRKALAYAIDQNTIVDSVFFDSATSAKGLLLKQSWAFDRNSAHFFYDPELAQQLLKENSFDFKQTLTMLVPTVESALNPNFNKTAEFIASNLRSIGVQVDIIALNNDALTTRLITGNYDTYLAAVNINSYDPDTIFNSLLSCDVSILEGNSSQWCNNKTQKLLESALLAENSNLRKLYYYQLQQIINQEQPYYPLAHAHRVDIFNNNVTGLTVNPLTGINFQYVTKSEAK